MRAGSDEPPLVDPEEKACVKPPSRVNVPVPTDGSVEPVLLLTSGGLELCSRLLAQQHEKEGEESVDLFHKLRLSIEWDLFLFL